MEQNFSLWETPPPVLFNPWKHHADFLREQIRSASARGPDALHGLAVQLRVVGADLMDLYHGTLPPAEIGRLVSSRLAADGLLEHRYLHKSGGATS